MTTKLDIAPGNDRELALARIIDAPRENVYRCWTDPKLVTQWFAPKPWTTPRAEMDVRTGGSTLVVMASPDGHEFPNPGVFLEVILQVFIEIFPDIGAGIIGAVIADHRFLINLRKQGTELLICFSDDFRSLFRCNRA